MFNGLKNWGLLYCSKGHSRDSRDQGQSGPKGPLTEHTRLTKHTQAHMGEAGASRFHGQGIQTPIHPTHPLLACTCGTGPSFAAFLCSSGARWPNRPLMCDT
eukprot:1156986-Pelagomonas_calceolata.AAC.2